MTIVIQTDIDPQENGRYDQSMAIDAVCHAFREITENPIGLKLLDDLGTKEITIVVTNRENSERMGRTDSVLWNPTQGVMHQTNNGVESPATILFHELRHIAEGVFSDHPAERGIMDPVVAETNRYLRYEGIPGRQHNYDGGRMTTWGPASTQCSTTAGDR